MAKQKQADIKDAVRIGIFGASGSGKSYRARELVSNLGRVIVFDGIGDFARGGGFKTCYSLTDVLTLVKKGWKTGFKICFVPELGEEETSLDKLSKSLQHMQSGYMAETSKAKITLVVDEMDLSFPSGIRQRMPKHGFIGLCLRGRHYGINLIGISQRPKLVDNSFRANMSAVYLFMLAEPDDIDVAIRLIGREYAQTFRNLNKYQYVYKSGNYVKIKK